MPSTNAEIKLLNQALAAKIAAGEVVERPVSVVKELVENALDAGATEITVEIADGGRTLIRVTDNGAGIPAEQLATAFQRHATSKISTEEDLQAIQTLGFRGEALASIAAVSRVEMITRAVDRPVGCRITLHGGEIISQEDTGCPTGTTLLVEQLFYNTPVRLKFLRQDRTEAGLIIDLVSRIAIAYPDVRFRMIHNQATLFATPGKGNIFDHIITVYSADLGRRLLHATGGEDDCQVSAYLSPPELARPSGKYQITFVNGRSVKSPLLDQAVRAAYRERLPEGRSPACFLFLTVDPAKVDVNVHPHKTEIQFDEPERVAGIVTAVLEKALAAPVHAGERRPGQGSVASGIAAAAPGHVYGTPPGQGMCASDIAAAAPGHVYGTSSGQGSHTSLQPMGNQPSGRTKDESVATQEFGGQTEQVDIKSILSAKRARQYDAASAEADHLRETAPGEFAFTAEGRPTPTPARPFDISGIRLIGSAFGSYLVGVDEDSLYLIDQHAAHERILFETLLSAYERSSAPSQLLLTPERVEVDAAAMVEPEAWLDPLAQMGFQMEIFGKRVFLLKALPASLSLAEAGTFLEIYLETAAHSRRYRDPGEIRKIVGRSCKAAIKANRRLDEKEATRLLLDLAACENPWSCPHGRPTIIRQSRTTIEKWFLRS